MLAAPHHDGSSRFVETDAPALGDRVAVRVEVPDAAGVDRLWVRRVADSEPFFTDARVDGRADGVTTWVTEVAVANPTTPYRFLLDGPGGRRWLTAAGLVAHDPTDRTDFRLAAGPPPPSWAGDAACYQIFIDRFARGGASEDWPAWALRADWADPVRSGEGAVSMRQLYGGDLPGIAGRLDHLVDLGVDCIYLTPMFAAPSNHRYNATSFDHVDPFLGGDAALAALADACHRRGIRLLGDLTANHTGDTHPWFAAAQADPAAPEASWYHFTDHPDGYLAWNGEPSLPKLDHRAAAMRRALYEGSGSVVDRYLREPFNLDGWRVDAANMAGRAGAVDTAAELRRTLVETVRAANPGGLVIAEHCHDATEDLDGQGWHGTMHYAGFTRPAWEWLGAGRDEVGFLGEPVPPPRLAGDTVAGTIDAFRAAVPWRVYAHHLNLLSSHDTARWRSVVGSAEAAIVGAVWLATWPGIPTTFAGDELGLTGDRDEAARRPMPWDGRGWDTRIHAAWRDVFRVRREHQALRRGGFRWAAITGDVLAYLREDELGERILVHLRRAPGEPVRLDAPLLGAAGGTDLLSGATMAASGGVLALPGDGPAAQVWALEG